MIAYKNIYKQTHPTQLHHHRHDDDDSHEKAAAAEAASTIWLSAISKKLFDFIIFMNLWHLFWYKEMRETRSLLWFIWGTWKIFENQKQWNSLEFCNWECRIGQG